ncbi:ABC transporter permease [uncultured Algoriphagus sp.]|uniref:ABC transporter permease n=3 Tax=Algoriphagus TaxID=246875 RepID=UPI0025947BD4|nr:ABC transporter permease [uncultured Algoriphagus sp.]
MWKNYFKIAWRNFIKNRLYSFLNVLGLSIGMAVCLIIMLFVGYERGFDQMHSKNVFRLNEVQNWEGMVAPQKVALSMFPMGPTLNEEFSEVLNYTTMTNGGDLILMDKGERVTIPNTIWADERFLEVFDFELVQGDKSTALKEPNGMILTEKRAKILFGDEPALGKVLPVADTDSAFAVVTGVMRDIPERSHLQFEGVIAMNTFFDDQEGPGWGANWFNTYLELVDDVDMESMESRFPEYLISHLGEDADENFQLFLQPLSDIHSGSSEITHDYFNYKKFDKSYVQVFFFIGLIVLFIAGINFVNLASAKSIGRGLEIGIRKTSGASRWQLYLQFITESVLMSLVSLFFAFLIVILSLGSFNELSGRSIDFPLLSDPILLGGSIFGAILGGILSGIYPAGVLTGFNPIKVLKGNSKSGTQKSGFRNGLVVVQFAAAIFLITATFFANRQLKFMQQRDLGFSKEQVIVLPLNNSYSDRFITLKQELLSFSKVEQVTASGQRLGNNLHQTSASYRGSGEERSLATSQIAVDPSFLDVYEMELVAGRNFDPENESEIGRTYIINESLAHELLEDDEKVEDLIGANFYIFGTDSTASIIGVAKDFNFNSLHHKIETLAMFNSGNQGFSEISIRTSSDDFAQTIGHIQASWDKVIPEQPMEYEFLDDHFAELYQADQTLETIVSLLTGLSILVSCLGLFGLVSFATEQRVKEIGIRKVLGASVLGVVSLISGDFIKLILISILIAVPISWFVVKEWVNDFAYQIELDWWVFVLAALSAIVVALFTISTQATKAALINPAKTLKSE